MLNLEIIAHSSENFTYNSLFCAGTFAVSSSEIDSELDVASFPFVIWGVLLVVLEDLITPVGFFTAAINLKQPKTFNYPQQYLFVNSLYY